MSSESKVPIFCFGMPRTGTLSLSKALQTLGYPSVHHGTDMKPHDTEWIALGEAANRTFPSLPTYNPNKPPFTREEWDAIFAGRYDAVSDVFAYYALSLIAAYPEAKVILVERDVNAWLQSWRTQKRLWFGPIVFWLLHLVEPVTGSKAFSTPKKFIMGWIGSNRRAAVFDKAEEAYRRHYRDVREAMSHRSPELFLDFRLEQGWEPLCAFLGKDVPKQPFPTANERKTHMEIARRNRRLAAWQVVRLPLMIALISFVGMWVWKFYVT